MDQPTLAARQFGDTAANYLSSSVHATGADLDRICELAHQLKPPQALDLGCGAGHVSFALARAGVPRVIAYDLSERMLAVVEQEARAKDYRAIESRRGAAEHLPFDASSFELIVTRFSAHHWLSVSSALAQVSRLLRPGGKFVVIDVFSPESPLLDTTLQAFEVLRDRSHVRNYRLSEWYSMLSGCGLRDPSSHHWRLSLEFESWVRRIATPELRIQALRTFMDDMPAEAKQYFALTAERSFQIDAAWIEVSKPA